MTDSGREAALEVRPAVPADLPALTDIYNHYVLNTAATFDLEPYSVTARQAWFDHYLPTGPYRLLVAVLDGDVAGYASSSRFRPRPAYDTSIEVTVYLRPDVTRGGIGSALYERMFSDLRAEPLHRAYAVIAVPNPASVALHAKFGFAPIGTMREVGRKFDQWWDVVMMERSLAT
ncbi:MAG TPA: GNAT family N-acetyltransferase [Mycobacteriales bacterium]|nr:GNAT family N-acetyltransferase [Mycobacteriales bacterium]